MRGEYVSQPPISMIGRISIDPIRADGMRAAMPVASSRFAALTM